MDDNEIRHRVWKILLLKYLDISKRKHPNWSITLERCGCAFLQYPACHEDTPEYIFVRDPAIGNIRVPREVAIKILVLGDLP